MHRLVTAADGSDGVELDRARRARDSRSEIMKIKQMVGLAPVALPAWAEKQVPVPFGAPLFASVLALGLLAAANLPAAEGISNVRFSQRSGTNLVDLRYDLSTTSTNLLFVTVAVSTNGGNTYNLPATHFSGDVGFGVTAGTNKWIVWDAVRDWPDRFSTNVFFRLSAADAPPSMALIPAGSFTMGDSLDGDSHALPLHTVHVSAFCMDRFEVTKALWDEVYQWATNRAVGVRYSFEYGAGGAAADHPALYMTWFDAVKWCNARSEKEGRTPAYYTSAGQSNVYRTGVIYMQASCMKWSSGYRLPTEAEWEKAARGGMSGHRFPWSDTEDITHSRANYFSDGEFPYDTSPTQGYPPSYDWTWWPPTFPVGYSAANGYGLCDMAGNVSEWCWDWDGSYSSGSQTDPRGPASGSRRVLRGGSWSEDDGASSCRTASREANYENWNEVYIGFRTVLAAGQ